MADGTDFESTQENVTSGKSCFYSENISIRTECIITLISGNCEGNFNFAGKQANISLCVVISVNFEPAMINFPYFY